MIQIHIRYNKGKKQGDKFKYFSTCILSPTIAGAGQQSFNTCLRCTSYRECRPTHQISVQWWASVVAHCWFNGGQSSTTLAHHHPVETSVVFVLTVEGSTPCTQVGPSLTNHWICCILCANTWHSPNAVSMLTHSLRRWPVILRLTIVIPAPEIPNNTLAQCWSNAGPPSVTPVNNIPTKTLAALNHKYNSEKKILNTW